jgi:hypothetical protein
VAATPSPSTTPQGFLALGRRDRAAATDLIATLDLKEQVALVCETPLAHRSEILGLLPVPEAVVPLMPEAELCFTLKAIGIEDTGWLLPYATAEQVVACVDLDAWKGNLPDYHNLDRWLETLASSGEEVLLSAIRALDPEVVVLFLRQRIHCVQKPDDDDGWQPPVGGQTQEGQFYFTAIREGDDLNAITTMLRALFSADYWTYFRMLQGVIHEPTAENEEWALRWRTGRLEDLGFPTWDRASGIYRFIRPDERALIDGDQQALDAPEWHLPVWMPSLPAALDNHHLLFRTLARMDAAERRSALFVFIALANKVAVADRMELSDAESTPRAIEKAAALASAGLEFIATAHALDAPEVLRRVTIDRLFSVGANLDPDGARPKAVTPSDPEAPGDSDAGTLPGEPE